MAPFLLAIHLASQSLPDNKNPFSRGGYLFIFQRVLLLLSLRISLVFVQPVFGVFSFSAILVDLSMDDNKEKHMIIT